MSKNGSVTATTHRLAKREIAGLKQRIAELERKLTHNPADARCQLYKQTLRFQEEARKFNETHDEATRYRAALVNIISNHYVSGDVSRIIIDALGRLRRKGANDEATKRT